jgi:hypothetical protein
LSNSRVSSSRRKTSRKNSVKTVTKTTGKFAAQSAAKAKYAAKDKAKNKANKKATAKKFLDNAVVKSKGKVSDKASVAVNKILLADEFDNKLSQPIRFIGLSLSGGKADKACLVVLDYFTDQKKIFLSRLYEKIKTEEFISADLKIHEIVTQYQDRLESVAFDVPLSMPKCINCRLQCPGYESCEEAEIVWLRNFYQKVNQNKRPNKLFTPYTQRCIEAFVAHGLEETFEIHHALGANQAPLLARAAFIKRRLQVEAIEVFPKLSVWRLGLELKVAKSHLRHYRHSVGGDESRRLFLQAMADKYGLFIYQQDMKSMIDNYHAFEALICAYTAFLKFQKQTQAKPKSFPEGEAWIDFPIEN